MKLTNFIILICTLACQSLVYASENEMNINIKNNNEEIINPQITPINNKEKEYIVIQPGLISSSPIISDKTFEKISKKTILEDKEFTENDIIELDKKFNHVIKVLKKEHVFEKIKETATKYNIKPEAVAACIIGEHVFNVSIVDKFQNYFINIYSKWIDKHNTIHDVYIEFLNEPEIKKIIENKNISDYEKYDTIFNIYNNKYRGTKDYPNKNFIFSFFNPVGAGLTYGLGQLSPARILLTNDIAVNYGNLPRINPEDTESLYHATLDVDININYVAASVVASTEIYKKYAGFDISNNIGIIATLYNLGNEKYRAKLLKRENKKNKKITYPQENFYGWYMNVKEKEIEKLFKDNIS